MEKYYIGIDLGGTNIKAGLVSEAGEIIQKLSWKTRVERAQEEVALDLGNIAIALIQENNLKPEQILALGIGAPGTVNNDTGAFVFAGNLNFEQLPVRRLVQSVIDYPVFLGNDANFAALAESRLGASKNTHSSVMITIGTGIGGGIIINNRVHDGFNHVGSEIGHAIINFKDGEYCTCGNYGCFEAYSSAHSLIRDTERAASRNPDSILNEKIAANQNRANGKMAFDAMRAGDESAKQVVEEYIEALSVGVASVINMLMPEMVVLGGGVSHEGDPLLLPVREKSLKYSFLFGQVDYPKIVLAEMGNDAGIIGAALFAQDAIKDGLAGR